MFSTSPKSSNRLGHLWCLDYLIRSVLQRHQRVWPLSLWNTFSHPWSTSLCLSLSVSASLSPLASLSHLPALAMSAFLFLPSLCLHPPIKWYRYTQIYHVYRLEQGVVDIGEGWSGVCPHSCNLLFRTLPLIIAQPYYSADTRRRTVSGGGIQGFSGRSVHEVQNENLNPKSLNSLPSTHASIPWWNNEIYLSLRKTNNILTIPEYQQSDINILCNKEWNNPI